MRYADDFVVCFEYKIEAELFHSKLYERFKKFGLELAEDKTNRIKFNRFEIETSGIFTFLGFVYRRKVSRKGISIVSRTVSPKKMKQKLKDFTKWCKENRGKSISWIISLVKSKIQGFKNYYYTYGDSKSLSKLVHHYTEILFKWLNRRSQRKSYNWRNYIDMLNFYNVFSLIRQNDNGYQLSFLYLFD